MYILCSIKKTKKFQNVNKMSWVGIHQIHLSEQRHGLGTMDEEPLGSFPSSCAPAAPRL